MGQEFNMPASTIKNIGNRPAEFIKEAGKYTQIDGERFVSVIEKDTGHIVAFWDKEVQLIEEENPTALPMLFNQIQNTPRAEKGSFEWHNDAMTFSTPWDYLAGNAIRDYLGADNRHIPASGDVESKSQFSESRPIESRALDFIRYEIRTEDFANWVRKE
uniref:Uncharacterized protein n=1 Tax=uncultured Thiotrichaceae bacterium TaxID=298394 RepID=A0A6S6T685_9GAMM|nr:MAG: Unknown protein [uncultured Thiotrichaceae bacterium]